MSLNDDLVRVLDALQHTGFGARIEPETIAAVVARGLGEEAELDKEKLAWALLLSDIRPRCDRTRALIESVAHAGWIGAIAQGLLVPVAGEG